MALKKITPRGSRIAYDVDGSGPTVVLLAGLTMWRQHWDEAGYVARLADEFQVIRVDPLGHGDSAKPHDPALYDSREVPSDLVSVLDEEAVRTAILWGFSTGAQTVLGAASIAPSRVAAVICGSGGWRNEPVAEAAWCQPLAELLRSPEGSSSSGPVSDTPTLKPSNERSRATTPRRSPQCSRDRPGGAPTTTSSAFRS